MVPHGTLPSLGYVIWPSLYIHVFTREPCVLLNIDSLLARVELLLTKEAFY